MGDNLTTVDLGTGRKATAIAAGEYHTCAILDNSSIKCWGYNASGQLGLGNTTDSPNPSAVNMGSGITVKSIAAGGNHTCAILDNSSAVMCWGENDQGQLGLGTNTDSPNPSAVGSGITAKAITTGTEHTCALLDDDSVKCWGRGDEGQLGSGKTNDIISPPSASIVLGTNIDATAIASGKFHTCAILDNSSIKCWGSNTAGQLGQGDTNNRGDESSEMGDNLPVISL